MHQPRFVIPLRTGELERAPRVLILNAESELCLDELGDQLTLEADEAHRFEYFQARGFRVAPHVDGQEFDRALIQIGKHSDYNKAMVARAWDLVKIGGDILVEGPKNEGIDSLIRGIRALGALPQVEPKSHGKIAWFKRTESIGAIANWRKLGAPYINGAGYEVCAGIFSPKTVDKGTEFLLSALDGVELKGKFADFGAGYGALSKPLLAQNSGIESANLYENSALACNCLGKNVTDARAHIHWLSVEKAAREYFDVIVSNPPFHLGKAGDPDIGKAFIDAAARSLRARGTLYLVANRHLPYEGQMRARFGHVEEFAESNAFKIFKATRPHSR